MSKRINIVLPNATPARLDRFASKGSRSPLISRAVPQFIESSGTKALRQRLKREALENAARDLEMAAEWFPAEEDAAFVPAVPTVGRK